MIIKTSLNQQETKIFSRPYMLSFLLFPSAFLSLCPGAYPSLLQTKPHSLPSYLFYFIFVLSISLWCVLFLFTQNSIPLSSLVLCYVTMFPCLRAPLSCKDPVWLNTAAEHWDTVMGLLVMGTSGNQCFYSFTEDKAVMSSLHKVTLFSGAATVKLCDWTEH